jgi:hypothetical protein
MQIAMTLEDCSISPVRKRSSPTFSALRKTSFNKTNKRYFGLKTVCGTAVNVAPFSAKNYRPISAAAEGSYHPLRGCHYVNVFYLSSCNDDRLTFRASCHKQDVILHAWRSVKSSTYGRRITFVDGAAVSLRVATQAT